MGNPGFVILQTINGDIHVLMAGNECTHTKDILYKDIHTLYIYITLHVWFTYAFELRLLFDHCAR